MVIARLTCAYDCRLIADTNSTIAKPLCLRLSFDCRHKPYDYRMTADRCIVQAQMHYHLHTASNVHTVDRCTRGTRGTRG
jgi:hypothetical protein